MPHAHMHLHSIMHSCTHALACCWSLGLLLTVDASAMPIEPRQHELEIHAVSTVEDAALWGCGFNAQRASCLMFDGNTVMEGEPTGVMLPLSRFSIRADAINPETEPEAFGSLMLTQVNECNAMWQTTLASNDRTSCATEPLCMVEDPWIIQTRGRLVAGIHDGVDGNSRWVVGLALEMARQPANPAQEWDASYSCARIVFVPLAYAERFPSGVQDLEYLTAATWLDGVAQSAPSAQHSRPAADSICAAIFSRDSKKAQAEYEHGIEKCDIDHGFGSAVLTVSGYVGTCFVAGATAGGGVAAACRKFPIVAIGSAIGLTAIGVYVGCTYGVAAARQAHASCVRNARATRRLKLETAEIEYNHCIRVSLLNTAQPIPVAQ